MVDASIPDIALEPDHTVRKVQEKFRLDFTDEEATSYMQDLIDESASAVMAALAERIHKLAQFMRNWKSLFDRINCYQEYYNIYRIHVNQINAKIYR